MKEYRKNDVLEKLKAAFQDVLEQSVTDDVQMEFNFKKMLFSVFFKLF